MSELAPQVVPASFFVMASFLVALASTTSKYGFHVKRVSRVTPRNVGVSTCGTGWFFNFSETFSFAKRGSISGLSLSPRRPHHYATEVVVTDAACSVQCNRWGQDSETVAKIRGQLYEVRLFVGWLLNVPTTRECISGTDLLNNCTCSHTETEVADPTFHLTQSQYTDTGLTSQSTDPTTPGAWQGSHWSVNF